MNDSLTMPIPEKVLSQRALRGQSPAIEFAKLPRVTANKPMPIIEPAPDGAPLSPGDVLQLVRLFATQESWMDAGGEASALRENLCLVLSRPCVAAHKPHVIVAAIQQYKGGVPDDVKSFDDLLGFLKDTRDASDMPDVFYLGQIPGKEGQFCARLDSLHTIQIPAIPARLEGFLRDRRAARLQIDFVRDLHLRIFRAFASLGFDDVSWFSTQDLELLVNKGREELLVAETEHQQKITAKGKQEFGGGKAFPEAPIKAAEIKVLQM